MRFLFVMLVCLAFTCRISYADKTASNGQRNLNADHTPRRDQKPRRRNRENLGVPRPPKSPAHTQPAHSLNPPQNWERFSPDAKVVSPLNARVSHSTPVRPLFGNFSRTAAPPLTSLHHRSTNPAVISGAARVANWNTGAIDGAQVRRKP
jgi:hypothetical protein